MTRRMPAFRVAAPLLVLAAALAAATQPTSKTGEDSLPAGAVLRLGKVSRDAKDAVFATAVSPDGKVIASGHGDGAVRLWDATNGKELRRLAIGKEAVTALVWLPDGRRMLSQTPRDTPVLWDTQSGKQVRRFKPTMGHTNSGASMALSPDGRKLIYGDHEMHLADVETGEVLSRQVEGYRPVFSPDGKLLVTATQVSRHWEFVLLGHDAATGKLAREFPWPGKRDEVDDRLVALACTIDGRSVVAGCLDGTVRLWEVATGGHQLAYWTHSGSVNSVAAAPDGRHVATGGRDGEVRVRDLVSGWEALRLRGHRGPVTAVAFTPDGKRIISASQDGTVLVWRGPGPPAPARGELSKEELEAAWAALGGDEVGAAYRAGRRMLAAPGASVAFLRGKLAPAVAPAKGLPERLVAELGDARFATRERAAKELAKLGRLAEPALRKALAAGASEELRRRATGLLERVAPAGLNADELRQLRALEVAEHGGTAEGRRFLEEMARGAPGPLQTAWAAEALARLDRRPSR